MPSINDEIYTGLGSKWPSQTVGEWQEDCWVLLFMGVPPVLGTEQNTHPNSHVLKAHLTCIPRLSSNERNLSNGQRSIFHTFNLYPYSTLADIKRPDEGELRPTFFNMWVPALRIFKGSGFTERANLETLSGPACAQFSSSTCFLTLEFSSTLILL